LSGRRPDTGLLEALRVPGSQRPPLSPGMVRQPYRC